MGDGIHIFSKARDGHVGVWSIEETVVGINGLCEPASDVVLPCFEILTDDVANLVDCQADPLQSSCFDWRDI